MPRSLEKDEHARAREAFMVHVRRVVPYALFTAVLTGLYLIHAAFGPLSEEGLSSFQLILVMKAFLGLWLGLRGFNQKFLGINPWVFKSHKLPFFFIIVIIVLSQLIYL